MEEIPVNVSDTDNTQYKTLATFPFTPEKETLSVVRYLRKTKNLHIMCFVYDFSKSTITEEALVFSKLLKLSSAVMFNKRGVHLHSNSSAARTLLTKEYNAEAFYYRFWLRLCLFLTYFIVYPSRMYKFDIARGIGNVT